jgi:D-alanyl-D-alanine carboxypeptidase (penicillin-binding protein 5/6)
VLVAAGLDSSRQRASEAERLLEFGFREFREYRLFEAGQAVVEADVWLGDAQTVPLVGEDLIAVTLTREAREQLVVTVRYRSPVPAPVAKGTRLGELVVSAPGMEHHVVPLVAGADVARAGMLGRITGVLGHFLSGGA